MTELQQTEEAARLRIPVTPAFSRYGIFSPFLLAPLLLMAAIALFAPLDVLDQWPLARSFTERMHAWIPFLDVHAASTQYPQVALLTHSIAIVSAPYMALCWFVQMTLNYPVVLQRARLTGQPDGKALLTLLLAIPVEAILLYAMVGLPGDPSWAHGLTTARRGGLALLEASAMCGFGMLGAIPVVFRAYLDTHCGKRA